MVHNGLEAMLWEDTWVGDRPLSSVYANLFQIVHKKSATVAEVLKHHTSECVLSKSTCWTKSRVLVQSGGKGSKY